MASKLPLKHQRYEMILHVLYFQKQESLLISLIAMLLIELVDQNPVASIGLYVDCGSIYETPASFGATHLLERMAFKSTTNRSHLRIVREVEAIGGNVTASGSREHISYTYDALKTYIPQMVELLIDCVRNPAFLDWEVSEQVIYVFCILEFATQKFFAYLDLAIRYCDVFYSSTR